MEKEKPLQVQHTQLQNSSVPTIFHRKTSNFSPFRPTHESPKLAEKKAH
ncbi:hypothetical protein LOK49_LG11G00871 [Camellia lanceoleosa]|uniref:Uncharacterized protein n=1 Tax=Camellia lanceoleosa TaxID=1840588 RepID=A0ACC0FXP1_9ERIC|nr:hypothetical protein LOK49_LG11G00871 [Camellia lanceoleosa]